MPPRRAALSVLAAGLGLALLSACGQIPQQSSDRSACVFYFQQFDIASQFNQNEIRSRRDGAFVPNPALTRWRVLLIQNDCMTRPDDLARMGAVAAARDGRGVTERGPAAPAPGTVVAGTLVGDAEAAMAVAFWQGLGVRATSIGSPGLGRRVFIGPFATQAALDEAIAVAREAGFVAPYASRFFRF